MKPTRLKLLVMAVLLGVGVAFAESPANPVGATLARGALPGDITPEMLKQGREIFHQRGNCSSCHGKNGGGTFVAPALNDERHLHLQSASYDEILARIRTGVPQPKRSMIAMPPVGGASLSESEVHAVAAYVFSIDRSR